MEKQCIQTVLKANPLKNLARALNLAGIASLVMMALAVEVSLTDSYGMVGVVGFKAEGMELSCGGHYQPMEMGAFHPTAPCGSEILLINPHTGQRVYAPVVHRVLVNSQAEGRVADISPATAVALGINPDDIEARSVVVRPQLTAMDSMMAWMPVVPQLLRQMAPAHNNQLDAREWKSLTNNLLGECGNCGVPGMVAVAQVTQNRADLAFNNKRTLDAVVHDHAQFSWVRLNPSLRSAMPARAQARELAALFMLDRLSGDALAVQYLVGDRATHYYAFGLMNTPAWGKSARMEQVRMSKNVEALLRHRFYRLKA